VRCNDGASDEQAGDDERGHGREEEGEHGRDDEAEQRLAVGEGAAEDHDGLVGGAEDVEEAPGAEDAEEDEEGEGAGQERGREGEEDHGGVVDAEVAEVAAQSPCSIGEGVRPGERRPVEQLRPRLPVCKRAPRRLRQSAQKEAEGRRGQRRVGETDTRGRRGGAAGRRIGHGEQRGRRRCGSHGALSCGIELGMAFLYAAIDWWFNARPHYTSGCGADTGPACHCLSPVLLHTVHGFVTGAR
jgi:hypothetical protein